jgi:dihydroorotase/N-acyl-D-amino-acid deacylase
MKAPTPLTRAAVLLGAMLALAAAGPVRAEGGSAVKYDLILRGGRIVDGAGNPWFKGDLAVRGDRIAAVGDLGGATSRRVIDVRGLVVAPGFIDMLGQSEYTVLADPQVRSKITQGITTELTGEGGSVAPMTPYAIAELMPSLADLGVTIDWRDFAGYAGRLKAHGSAINFAHLVGATQVRMAVLKGENRPPTPAELEIMKRHVARAMEQGAFGLSSSLIYPPAAFAKTDELVELAKVAARHGGFYATHMRSEADGLLEAIEEAAAIGERAGLPVEIWHFKASGAKNWGKLDAALRAIEAARARGIDMTADIYPYPASMTGLSACLPPTASEGGNDALLARLKDPQQRARIRKEIESPEGGWETLFHEADGADKVLVVGLRAPGNRAYQGKRLSEIAALRGTDPIDTIFDLLVEENGAVDTVYFTMSEENVRRELEVPWIAFNCDAPGVRPEGPLGASMTHPRAYGTFPRILGRYVREEQILRLEDAVRRMTSLAAQRIGLRDRGLLRAGFYADVTVFDPATVNDRATFESPHRYSEGIVHVLVNGVPVIESGRITERRPGRILRGPGYRPAP